MSHFIEVYGQKNAQTNDQLISSYKSLIMEQMQTRHLVGVGAALILGDSVVWKEGFGYADKENKIPFTTNTALCIGSITKPFTGMGIMQLHEKKILDIDKPLIEYLPEFRIKTREFNINDITVKSVIQHTSGIPNDIFLNAWDENEKYTDVVDYLKNESLCFPVNVSFHYSNIGYSLLGHTILKVSHQDYPKYIQDKILKPTGMKNSGFAGHCKLKNVSKTYDSTGTYFPLKYGRNIPAGGLLSTIDDLVKFAQEIIAIYNGKKGGFLKPETLKMFDETNYDNIQSLNQCLGWEVFKNDSTLVISHGGSHHVAVAMVIIDLKKKNAAVFLVNTLGGMSFIQEANQNIWEHIGITGADIIHPYPYKNNSANEISVNLLKLHTGIYIDGGAQRIVRLEKDNLILNAEFGDYALQPATKDEFIPGIIHKPDSVQWFKKPRFIFNEAYGFKMLFWQDGNYKRQLLGNLEIPQEITEKWKSRLGKYKLEGQEIESADKFSEAELLIGDNDFLKLKISYTSGEYSYYLHIINENEVIFCGFDLTQGGETICFSKVNEIDVMKLFGLTMKKSIVNK